MIERVRNTKTGVNGSVIGWDPLSGTVVVKWDNGEQSIEMIEDVEEIEAHG